MKYFTIIPLLASAVYVQADSSSNPLIPSGISSGCTSFLTQLNTDSSLLSCSTALVKATSAFGAGSNSTDTSSSAVNAALNNLCGTLSACPEDNFRPKLTSFYAACQAELTTNANAGVIRIYDVLYGLFPFTQAACSKGDDGKYCVVELGQSSSSSGSLSRREEAYYPNITAFHDSNILFLLLQPTLPASSLCVPCTRAVLSSYISFESDIPYALGLGNSPLMSGQLPLYDAVQKTCQPSFLSGSVQAAGGIANSVLTSGAVDVLVSFKSLGVALATVILAFCATV